MTDTQNKQAGERTQTIRELLASDRTLKITKIHSRPTASGVKSFFTVQRGGGPRGTVVFKLAHFDMPVSATSAE